jgi:tetratricopeptide (TPR) repeat protein
MRGAAIAVLALACGCRSEPADSNNQRDAALSALDSALEKVHSDDPAGAIEDLTRAIELEPTLSMAFDWRGHCLNLLGMPAEALKDYDRAIELEPTYAWSHYARAMANHTLGRYDSAIAGYTRSIELDPKFVKAWFWRGFTRKLVGDYAGSAADLRRGLELQRGDAWALSELAKVEQARGHLDACESALDEIVRNDASNGSAHAHLGFLAAVRVDRTGSVAELAKACDLRAPEETYARIWTWMQHDDRAAADATLRGWFEEARFDDPWEEQLVAFLLGEGTDDQLVERAQIETEGRIARGTPKDFLVCEALFYAGLRNELTGEKEAAHGLYARAREQQAPEAWEWAMAEVRTRSLGR